MVDMDGPVDADDGTLCRPRVVVVFPSLSFPVVRDGMA